MITVVKLITNDRDNNYFEIIIATTISPTEMEYDKSRVLTKKEKAKIRLASVKNDLI